VERESRQKTTEKQMGSRNEQEEKKQKKKMDLEGGDETMKKMNGNLKPRKRMHAGNRKRKN